MAFQLVERPGPAFLVAAAALLVVQARMCECEFGPVGNGAKPDLDKRLAGTFGAAPSSANSCSAARASRLREPLLSCSLPSSMRKRTRKRPPTCGSVSATSTGPPSGPHQLAMPSGVVSASKTIDGRALIRRTSVRLVTVFSFSLRLPCFPHRPRADRGSSTRSVRSGAANPSLPAWARAGALPSRCARLSTG